MTELNDATLAAALKATSFAIVITDATSNILAVNEAFTDVTGYPAEAAIGKPPSFLSSGMHDAAFYGEMWAALNGTGHWAGEIWNRHRDGHAFVEWISIDAIRDDSGAVTNYVGVFNDISSRKSRESELEWRALHDPLTALPNRSLLNDRLTQSLERARRDGLMVAVMTLDLDGFKAVNDSHGHDAGDRLLKSVASRLAESIRGCDTVARVGGDEFVVLCPAIESPRVGTMVADRMLESLKLPIDCGPQAVTIGASIGIAFYPLHGMDEASLLHRADEAMYEAKQTGKARIKLAA